MSDEIERRYWENEHSGDLVRHELEGDEVRVFAKKWGSEDERSISPKSEIYMDVRLNASSVTEVDQTTYDRGRLLPDATTYAKAMAFAIEHHGDQRRKDAHHTPYVAHLAAVSALALEDGATPTQAVAALLHDTLEDCPTVTEEMLIAEFGADVHRIVVACTDRLPGENTLDIGWGERKRRYVEHLAAADEEVLLVSNADKLHNLMSFVADFQAGGPSEKFVGRAEQLRWYYGELGNIFAHRRPGERNEIRYAANLPRFLEALDAVGD